MIVLWGLLEDGPLSTVARHLSDIDTPVALVDQRRVAGFFFELTENAQEGRIVGPEFSFRCDQVTAVYVRPYNFADLDIFDGIGPESAEWQHAARFEQDMLDWCNVSGALVINRPQSMSSNSSKPFQMELIRKAGFRVPETLITTDAECVLEFQKRHGHIVYKSISSWRSIVQQLSSEDLTRLTDVESCPTQFQRFIDGIDWRVHVLGHSVYAHRIVSSRNDYRYAMDTQIESETLPNDLESQCLALTQELGLEFAGIDLRRTSDDEWYCFEVNPSPGFTYFDRSGAIGKALALRLAGSNNSH